MKPEALLIYDYETTSANPNEAVPVQVAATLHRAGQHPLIIMNLVCNPGCNIEQGASEVHGIYAKHVKTAPHHSIATYMLGNYAENLAERYNLIIGGQNHIGFDNTIARRTGWTEVGDYPQLDLLVLARRKLPNMHNHKLSSLYMERVGKELSGAHDAIVDVVGVGEVLDTFLKDFDDSYMEMAQFCGIPMAWDRVPIGKHKGKFVNISMKGWFGWMCRNTQIHLENADFAETLKVHFNDLWQVHVEGK